MTNPESFKPPLTERRSFPTLTTQTNAEGAPGSLFEPGSWGCFFSSLFHVDRYQPRSPSRVKLPTAPLPISRMFHQSPNHRIRMHVIQLFPFLFPAVHIEVIKPRLPERPQRFARRLFS